MTDPKIELTKLYGLHLACSDIEHAIRGTEQPNADWRPFAPSRFVYAYFTFSSIYSIDWQATTQKRQVVQWEPDRDGRWPRKQDQIKSLIRFCRGYLEEGAPGQFRAHLRLALKRFEVANPEAELDGIVPSNESRKV